MVSLPRVGAERANPWMINETALRFALVAVPLVRELFSCPSFLPGVLTFCEASYIRGYVLTSEPLLVQRFGWNYKLTLAELVSAEVDPKAMDRSIRTFGNGGMFCLAGFFRNNTLGSYCAFATDPKRSVVLKFINRTVVVTPDRPIDFVNRINGLRNL
jgi:hypothetical protein